MAPGRASVASGPCHARRPACLRIRGCGRRSATAMQAVPAPPPLAKRRPDVPVEVLAARTLSLATLGPRRRAERRAESVAALEALAGASLDGLRRRLPTRYWVLAMLALMGKSAREIAALVGYAGPTPVLKALRHPAVVRLIEEVRRAQLEAVLSGTDGVAAAARACPGSAGLTGGDSADLTASEAVHGSGPVAVAV